VQQLLHEDRGSVSAEQLVDRRFAPELSVVPGYSCSVGLYGSIFTIPVYTTQKKDPNDMLISSFRDNLHLVNSFDERQRHHDARRHDVGFPGV
jgi:hypothetical protein